MRLQTQPGWDASGRTTVVSSLRPLARLPRLRRLELFGVQPADRPLGDLEAAPDLVSARFSQYPRAEVERWYAATGASDAFAPSPGVADWD